MSYYRKKGKPYKRSDLGSFYINAHPSCEACGFPSEELHHIITRRSGGPDEEWNWLALCKGCHLLFHSLGRASFCKRYPHLTDKVREACERMGRVFDKGGK